MTRDPKQGELRGVRILETLEKLFKRPDTRLDAKKMLDTISPAARTYAEHLVKSGPLANATAAKDCGFTQAELEAAALELQTAVMALKF